MKVLFYVDHTAGNAKRTESGVETLQCVKVVNVISITKCFLLTSNMASKNYLLEVIIKCREVISYAILTWIIKLLAKLLALFIKLRSYTRPSVRPFVRSSVRPPVYLSVCPSFRSSVVSSSVFSSIFHRLKVFLYLITYPCDIVFDPIQVVPVTRINDITNNRQK